MTARALLPVLLLASTACRTAAPDAGRPTAWDGELRTWGTLRAALRDGHDQARVAVSDVAATGVFAVGALEGLAGEVTILDGEVWITEGTDPVTTRRGLTDDQATFLFAAQVDDWQAVPIAAAVDPSIFDTYLEQTARAHGLDTDQPFPFHVNGPLVHLHMHVIAGECPIRARMLGTESATPAFDVHEPAATGRLVGFYAPDAGGIVCHSGSVTHVHGVLEGDAALTGHVETVGLGAGATLWLPRL